MLWPHKHRMVRLWWNIKVRKSPCKFKLLAFIQCNRRIFTYLHSISFFFGYLYTIISIKGTYTCRRNFICESIVWVTRSWNTSPFSAFGPMNQAPSAAHGLWRPWSCFENILRQWLYIGAGLVIRCLFPPAPVARWAVLLRLWSIFAARK